jgi:hypothetical protein
MTVILIGLLKSKISLGIDKAQSELSELIAYSFSGAAESDVQSKAPELSIASAFSGPSCFTLSSTARRAGGVPARSRD